MPERGGPTAQSGILYQNSVASLYLGRLCDETDRIEAERVVRVRVEAPEYVDDVVVTYADHKTRYIQANERLDVGDQAWKQLWHNFAEQFSRNTFVKERDLLQLHLGEASSDSSLLLRELCDRARGEGDAAAWASRLSQRQDRLKASIADLLAPTLVVSDGVLHSFFSHLEIEAWTLVQIERDLVPLWMPQSDVGASTLFRLLRDRVGGHARFRKEFVASLLRADLVKTDRITFVRPADAQTILHAIAQCGALLRHHRSTLGKTGIHISRSVVDEIIGWTLASSSQCRVGLLLDNAGRGKTVVMRDVLVGLESRGQRVLAIKADQQLSGANDSLAVQHRLGLPDPLEQIVSRIAATSGLVLIVDQLDALSLSLAHDQESLNVALDIIARIRGIPNVTVLVSCRSFDRNIDPRLKRMEVDREFSLPLLTDDEVAPVLNALRLAAIDDLSPATRELIKTPLHLDLFTSLAVSITEPPSRLRDLQSLQDLYGLLWDEVVLPRTQSSSSAADKETLLRLVTKRMEQLQRTSIPRSSVSSIQAFDAMGAADALASAGILIRSSTEWTFFHQTFFDYCYARFFVGDGERLSDSVLASDQGLFNRSQVTHVLTYLRGTGQSEYLAELQTLVTAAELRLHLRHLILRWIGALPNPSKEEWLLMYRRLVDPVTRGMTVQAMAGNDAWLNSMISGVFDGLLRADNDFVDACFVPYLASVINTQAQAKVASYVDHWFSEDDRWWNRARVIVEATRKWTTHEATNLFERAVRRTPLDQLRFLFELDDVSAVDPVAGSRLLREIFDRILDEYSNDLAEAPTEESRVALGWRGVSERLEVLNGSAGMKALESVPKGAPAQFLDAMLPWLERMVNTVSPSRISSSYYPSDALSTGFGSSGYVVHSVLLQGYIDALAMTARLNKDAFFGFMDQLAKLPHLTPQLIMARAYVEIAEVHFASGLRFLLDDPRRLRLGDSDDNVTRSLLNAIASRLTDDDFHALERFIIAHTAKITAWRGGTNGLRWRGLDQLHLLRSLPVDHLSARGRAKLRELERKFPDIETVDRRSMTTAGWVGPPIPHDACERMSDSAWLSAMEKYANGVRHTAPLRGGALELSRVLEAQAKSNPRRFAELAMKFPDSVDDSYIDAVLDGLSQSDCPADWIYEIVRRFASPVRQGIHRRAAWALHKVVGRSGALPIDLLDLLESWVRGAPRADEAFYEAQPQDLYHGTINTDRGAALEALSTALIRANSDDAFQRLWRILEEASNDSSSVLRAGIVHALLYLFRNDRPRAITLFARVVQDEPRLQTTLPYQEFVYYASFGNFERVGPYIRVLMHAETKDARKRGAELAVLAALSSSGLESERARELAKDLSDEAETGRPEWREGAARIYSHNWADYPTDACEKGLERLWNDPVVEVRREVSWMTHRLRPEHAITKQEFLLNFAASKASKSGLHDFSEFLWQHGTVEGRWALSVVETLTQTDEQEQEPWHFGGGEDLVRLTLGIYTHATTSIELRERAMNAFDALMQRFAGHALNALSEWDRR